ncbi:uncharacterized protein BX663DRAFT_513265 [Cokeromyces recurvatus]|uniref:uncharacterized protein n=1 Tax=Cokeromyces recurvatus TaxID=90255 RepID=UPI002220D27E|nr:uncharacterized protein BX663DRAFT_513265 [Cokeromyces recurvatus]KAI7901554.1 hypothetical protein BX663DRAFT_513265 [Cokeromyces recurvatus]
MSQSSKGVHPFFLPKKTKVTTPSVSEEQSIVESPKQTERITRNKANQASVSISRNVNHQVPDTREHLLHANSSQCTCKGESSITNYVPITKPKFHSDHQQVQKSTIAKKKQNVSHEFAWLDRNVFGNCHITDNMYESTHQTSSLPPLPPPPPPPRHHVDFNNLIAQQAKSFRLRKRECKKREHQRDVTMLPPITNQAELEAFLTTHFPNWHMFPSCVLLSQSLSAHRQNTKQWTDKYRPKTIEGLMGSKHNFVYLRDWLHQMKIEPLSAPSSTTAGTIKKRKRTKKLVMQYDDDNEDDNDEAFLRMRSNVILLVGDHGVGKTAAVYTAAEQLDYEVFEINAGTRRSGKDIMSLVGEMTKSHLVAFGIAPPSSASGLYVDHPKSAPKTTTTKRKKLNPCFAPSTTKIQKNESKLLKHFLRKKESAKVALPFTPATKQSLILLEEVDILFEEDKGFWSSVIELSQKSKRPIIMTCNDPNQIPFESLCIQMVLNLKPPSESELLPYLWLVCYAEGYVVDPVDLICLMAFLGRNIRQLLRTLELYIGDHIFGRYLGIENDMDKVEIKLKSVPSKLAIDTFRLARYYEGIEESHNKEEEDEEGDDFDSIVQALENNAFVDTWLGWKEDSNLIQESVEDQLNGYTNLCIENEGDISKAFIEEIESLLTILNSQTIKSNTWSKIILDEESHWEEVCDARSINLEDYKEAIEKLLSPRMIYQPNEYNLTMDYIPHIQLMLTFNHDIQGRSTRTKRKRLHLPLSEDCIHVLSTYKPLVDETEFWTNRLDKLKKDSVSDA